MYTCTFWQGIMKWALSQKKNYFHFFVKSTFSVKHFIFPVLDLPRSIKMCKYKKNASIHVMNYFISGLRNLCEPADRLRNKQRYKTIKSCIAGINEKRSRNKWIGVKS